MNVRTLIFALAATLAMGLGGCSDSSSGGRPEPLNPDPPGDPPPPEDPDPPEGEPSATLTVDDVEVHEDNGSVNFIVRAAGVESDEVRVDFATRDGTATAGSDYVAAAGTLTFDEANTQQTVSVDLIDDSEPEERETFHLQLSNPLNAEIEKATGVATIVDDDSPEACGEPDVDASSDRGAFLWKDCESGIWHFRVLEQDEQVAYQGIASAAEPFVDVVPVATSGDDLVENDPAEVLTFSVSGGSEAAGFDFEVADDAGTCFDLQAPADEPVSVGRDRALQSTSFDLATLEGCDVQEPPGASSAFNIVVLFTDDQRIGTLDLSDGTTDVMPNVKDRLLPRGVNFENAYVPTPLCCPARASTFSGGFLAQNTGVLDNLPPNGGMRRFDDSVNIGTRLQEAGYRTMFIGKWLNDYHVHAPYIPPGWDVFAGHAKPLAQMDWTNFRYAIGSTGKSSGVGEEITSAGQYQAYFERDRIIEFIEQAPEDEPYMVFWSTAAPHLPAIADEQDKDSFSEFTYRERGYGEKDRTDKPRWVRSPGQPVGDDEEVRDQLRSLHSLDRAFGGLLDTIAARGELDETVFIVTSDNGYMWGEHGLWNKKKPYEESIKVPLLVVMPGIEPRNDRHLVSAVLDLGPTLYEIADITGESEGRSLVPLLRDPSAGWRNEIFIEHYGLKQNLLEVWAGIRHGDWKYVKYWYGEEELYNLRDDPFELENLIPVNPPAGPPVAGARACGDSIPFEECADYLEARVDDRLGLAIHPVWSTDDGTVGKPYDLQIPAWGGRPPFEWKVESGRLPPGLGLDRATGRISGTPTEAGSWTFRLQVTGSSMAIQAERPQTYVSGAYTIDIMRAGAG